MNNNVSLRSRIRKAARRLWLIGTATAAIWAVVAALLVAVVGVWLDLLWDLPPEGRLTALGIGAGSGVLLAIVLIVRTARTAGRAALARRLDAAAGSGGQILTGMELDAVLAGDRPARAAPLTTGLSHITVEAAAAVAGRAPLARAVPLRPLSRSAAVLVALATLLGAWIALAPALATTQWRRFTDPWADVPPYSPLSFTVTPGDVQVLYGTDQEITAEIEGGAADRLELVLVGPDDHQTIVPMFSETGGRWRAVLSRVVEPADYFVRAERARSQRYHMSILTVPQIESVRVRVEPPEYSGQPSYDGPLPDDGLRGLRGTKVSLRVTSNRPLAGGTISLAAPSGNRTIAMVPDGPDRKEAVGPFEILGDGRFECRIRDEAGQESQQPVAGTLTLVADQHPWVRVLEPQPVSLATPTARVPVVLLAEDDCGVARLQLFRSLNDSRPLPVDFPLPARRPHRHQQSVELPLASYGLSPGDTLKLFARVEDNDPAGAKGSESGMITLRIISQEEFEKMLRVREGIEALASKYREARRRMEGMSEEVQGLRKKLQKLPPRGALAQETREEIRRLQRLMRRDAESMRRAAAHRMPVDLDEKLSNELGQMADATEELAKELEKLEKQLDLLNENLDKQLEAMAKRLGQKKQEYDESVTRPIEHLEAIFPLLVDQQRFVTLVLRQRDLADRMTALEGQDGKDDPALRSRMRDLEHEQRGIRETLDALLGDIEDHATRLPEVAELKRLRETAKKFVADLRASGAAEAMTQSESALAEFAGTRAHAKANEAAEILERFLKRCEGGLGSQCQGAIVFQPRLARCLGNSIAQLLAEMGLSAGSGFGMGQGTYGLYGAMGGMSGAGSGEYGDPHGRPIGSGQPRRFEGAAGGNPDTLNASDAEAIGRAAGAGETPVPVRYRRAVGQYFQRLAEEIGERPKGRKEKRP